MCISWNWKVFCWYLNSGKIWFWNVLLLVTLTCTTYLTNASQDEFWSHGRASYSVELRPIGASRGGGGSCLLEQKISEIWLIKFKNIIHTWSGKVFKGTVVNWALSSLHGGSLEINLIGFKYCQVSQSLSFYLNNLNFVKESNQLREY